MYFLFSRDLLLRMPVKKPADYAADSQSFLEDPHFRAALYLASPVFFATLERLNFQSAGLTEKEENTLRKYINRYCFRPTPFGLFASVTLGQWAAGAGMQETTMPEFDANFQVDQTYQTVMGQEILIHELAEYARFEGNPSVYRVLNEYRFFRTSTDETGRQREYLLQSIAFSILLKDLMGWCHKGRTLKEIADYIVQVAACSLPEAAEYADFLVDAQLLVNCRRQHITGPDYLGDLLHQRHVQPSSWSHTVMAIYENVRTHTAAEPAVIQRLNDQLKTLLPERQPGGKIDALSAILYRRSAESWPGIHYQDALRDGIYALDVLSPPDRLPAMDSFIASFQQHFEGQTLPLLIALDPEAGIGYQQPSSEKETPLLETLHIHYKPKTGTPPEWTAAQSLLLKCWLRNNHGKLPVIELADEDLESLKAPENRQMLGMSVLFRISGNNLFIESAGGNNAPALLGRFTVVNEETHMAAKNMAVLMEQQNPQLIFAELLHLGDPHTDNVNRRENIYSYELPLTAASTLPKENQLELGDLYVRVEQGKVVLFSKKHGKPVIPRLSSAYNHSLNKLPLFRFLADLPYQYGRSNLGFDLRQFFPGQSFYPRVAYRDTVLCLATWIISDNDLEILQQAPRKELIGAFNKLSRRIHLAVNFSLTEGDQQLVFNGGRNADILFFCGCVRGKKEAVLKEFLPQPEVRQYNAYLLPSEPLRFPFPAGIPYAGGIKVPRKYLPGSEWLYLKIYAPRIGAGLLLLRLQPLLHKRYTNGKISKWFFIRYDDHAPHIRLRMKIVPGDAGEVLIAFKEKLETRIQQHVIREYQVEVYSRELERYGAAGMEITEDFFWASSELVLSYLKQNSYGTRGYAHHFALYSTLAIVDVFIPMRDGQLVFLLETYQQFLPEFAEEKINVELDKKYRELSTGIQAVMKTADPAMQSGSIKAAQRFVGILKEVQQNMVTAHEERLYYLRSIIHMHLNRLFTDEPRKQEMITYYFLYKYLLSIKGREKAAE